MNRRSSHGPGLAKGSARIRRLVPLALVTAALALLMASPASATPATPTPAPTATSAPSQSPSPQVSWIAPTTAPAQPTGKDECGWMDVGCKVNKAVNGWFTDLVRDAVNPAFALVGRTLLSSPPPALLSRVRELTGQVRVVSNALLVLFVLAGGVIVMAYGSAQTATTAVELIPRLVLATILSNSSLTISEYAVQFANSLVDGLVGTGVDADRAGNLLAGRVAAVVNDPVNAALYLVLLAGGSVLLGLILAFIAVIRVTLLLFLIISAPLALLCHALPQTEGIARLWWRAFTGVLAIQALQALVLLLAFKVHLTDSPDLFAAAGRPSPAGSALDVLILIGLLYVLIKIPGWVARSIWQQAKPQLLMRAVKGVVVYKTLGALGGVFRGARSRPSPGPTVTAHRHGMGSRTVRPRPTARPASSAAGSPPTASGGKPMNPPTRPSPSGSASASSRSPQQLALPLGITPASSRKAHQGKQLALPFPVTRVPRPPTAAPPPVKATWIRPKPPYVQDRLPGMPTRPARPRQLRLRLDPPPRRMPKRGDR
ncbi:ABC transporter ATP-binding protein [Microbispora sp. H10836]|uniref:ABC transporter ATP-binding protein n=1 Tax=Microbispora sp. H10836 TaxID=2729106 RepID=UPI001472CA4F|nr:ABC transporter ATP-binding protein [Microbispora sp. H10836]